jgi:hypothetical protein
MHVVLKILLILLRKFSSYISDLFSRNQHSLLSRVLFFIFLTSSAFSESFTEYQFEWDSSTKSFTLDGNSSPSIVLYEHCSYLIRSVGARFSISENNITHYEGDDIFFNEGIQGNGEFILLTPDQNSSRTLYYQNFDSIDSLIGTIEIKEFDNLGLLRMNQPESFANFGSNVVLSDDLTLFASAPGFNENEGLVIRSSKQIDGSYLNESNIVSPTEEKDFWGSSLFFDNNQSQLLVGSSNSADFRGSLYAYSLSTLQTKLLFEGEEMGDLFGWSFSTYHEKLIVSALSVTNPTGGHFSVFSNSYSNPFVLHEKVQPGNPQFGNEYGYDICILEDLIAVGAPGEDDLARQDCGAVYLYRLEENNLEGYKVLSSIRNDGDRFGHSVILDNGFMFVGAPSGDGSSTKSGLVHIFDFRDEDLGVKEIFRLLPPNEGASQNFSQDISVVGDFVFVSSPGAEGVGAIYVFKKSGLTNAYSWELANSIPLNLFSDDLSPSDKISIDVNKGVLAIGLEKESANEIEAGAVQILRNPAWNISSPLQIPPFFPFDSPSTVTIEEDSAGVAIDFNASLPIGIDTDLVWEVNSTSLYINNKDYDINRSSGVFNFFPPSNLNGTIPFTLSVHANNQKIVHDFQISIGPIEDEPYFEDFNSAENISYKLPVSTVDETYDYLFYIFDPDNDELTLSLVEGEGERGLPGGLSLIGSRIKGTPVQEGNYTLQLCLTDGDFNVTQSFNIEVFPKNLTPSCSFNGEPLSSPASINFKFTENFSSKDWANSLSSLIISDQPGQELSVEVLQYPNSGVLSVISPFKDLTDIRYTPNLYFHGSDSFTLRFKDNHKGFQKFFDLGFNIEIESKNSAPFITSDKPQIRVFEGTFFQHSFDVFDAEEDFYELSFYNLPKWIKFDGRRKIFGTPQRSDYQESPEPVFISVTDQWGNSFTDKFLVEVVPQNYPPQISFLDQNESQVSFNVIEDTSLSFQLSGQDSESETTPLVWKVSKYPSNGEVQLTWHDTGLAQINYTPDGNFSGSDFFEILAHEALDEFSFDIIRVNIDVLPVPDLPKFKSEPYPGVIRDKPWVYEVYGIDGDTNDNLTLTTLTNLPEWLRLTQSDDRVWTFRGLPNSNENVDIRLLLSDGNSSVEQAFKLKVLESLDALTFLDNQQISLVDITNDSRNKECHVSLNEDANWSLDSLSVNSNDDVRVKWQITKPADHGIFTFDSSKNGKVENLYYQPDSNFHGDDQIELTAYDNYSSVKLVIYIDVKSIPDEIRFLEIPNGVLRSLDENFDFNISYQDGDGLSSLNEIQLDGFPSWLTSEVLSEDEFSKSIRFFGEPPVTQEVQTFQLNVSVSNSIGDKVNRSFAIEVNYYNQPPRLSVGSIYDKLIEDSYTLENPKVWNDFVSIDDKETKDPNEFSWVIIEKAKNGVARISESGDWMSYYPNPDFSGIDTFIVKVTDGKGYNNASPRSVQLPVTIEVSQVNDKPRFITSPPSKSNIPSRVIWNDEESYRYEIVVLDTDWPWQGYPSLMLDSSIPSWMKWKTLGGGRAIISGDPKWFNEGNYSFEISANSGLDVVKQSFVLEIKVDDYPPRIFNPSGKEVHQRTQIFIEEDNHNGEVNRALSGFSAINPDKSFGETLMWLLYKKATSDAHISFNSNLNADKSMAYISDFSYELPENFNGIDTFTLLADEGDRFTPVVFEVHVKAIPDPPIFITAGPLELSVGRNSYFERKIFANDPDGDAISYKLLQSNSNNKWLSLREANNNYVALEGVAPHTLGKQTFSLVVSDVTGRFSVLQIYVDIVE